VVIETIHHNALNENGSGGVILGKVPAQQASNTFVFFLASAILAVTSVYFFMSGIPKGGYILLLCAAAFSGVGRYLGRRGQ